jgi:hypothetical protein
MDEQINQTKPNQQVTKKRKMVSRIFNQTEPQKSPVQSSITVFKNK